MASKEILDKLLAQPDSLKAERVGEEFLVNDVRGDTLPNTGNLATFLLLQNFYKGADATDTRAKETLENIGKAVNEENKYLLEAINILNGSLPDDASEAQKMAVANIKSKYGKGIDGAAVLSNLLRRKANELEFDLMINPLVAGLVADRVNEKKGGVWADADKRKTAVDGYIKLYTGE